MLSISPHSLILVACLFLRSHTLVSSMHIASYTKIHIKMAVRLRVYTSNLRVNKEIAGISTLSEAQVFYLLNKITLKNKFEQLKVKKTCSGKHL